MSKRNLYMVQVDQMYTGMTFQSAYLPYAVGLLVANAFQEEKVRHAYEMREFLILREDTDRVMERIENPAVVGFSCYVWNTEYNKRLAEKIKAKYPECLIVFGGHNVPPDTQMLEQFPFIDVLIHGEGEIPFRALLTELLEDAPDLSKVPSLSFRRDDGSLERT
ncbi:MAG: cobalamin-dependent protein, partial [Oscillospiraceae bacterium]|nr:cobalamin-dependent protein [Oscillospiraceae bacterium]